MSYSCNISFKTMNPAALYKFLTGYKAILTSHLEDVAKEEYTYCPTVRYRECPYDLSNANRRSAAQAWVKAVFSYRFFYLSDHDLLGVYGVPKCMRWLFDDTVYFQNSTDQDYNFNTWHKIPLFRGIANRWQSYDEAMVRDKCELTPEDDVEYHRRTGCYEEIWNNYVSDTLEDDDHAIYLSCLGYWDLDQIGRFIYLCEALACEQLNKE